MFKVLVISALFVCSHSQLVIPRRISTQVLTNNVLPAPNVVPLGPQVAVPGQFQVGIAPPLGAYSVRGADQVAANIGQQIQRLFTQEILPIQDLDAPTGPQVVQVKSQQLPVIVHFQSESAPVQVETSHIPSAPEEVTITRSEDHPRHVIHEVIRPVIQEIREVIQPYRRLTQEIRPVAEEVNTNIATNQGAGAALVAGPAPAVVAAPAQAVVGGPGQIIGAPAPLFVGSYIQAYIDSLRNRAPDLRLVSAPTVALAPAPAPVAIAPAPVAVETPIAVEAVPAQTVVRRIGNGGIASFSRKYVEYTN